MLLFVDDIAYITTGPSSLQNQLDAVAIGIKKNKREKEKYLGVPFYIMALKHAVDVLNK